MTPLCESILYFSKCNAFFLCILWVEYCSFKDSLFWVCWLSILDFSSFVLSSLISFSLLFCGSLFSSPIYTIVFEWVISFFDFGVCSISIFFKCINLSEDNCFFFCNTFFWSFLDSSWSSGRSIILCLILFFIDLKFDIKFKNLILSSSWIFLFKLSLLVSALFIVFLFFILFIPLKFISLFWVSNFFSFLSLANWFFLNKLDFFDVGEKHLWILFDTKNKFLSSVWIRLILEFLIGESLTAILFIFICLMLFAKLLTKFLIDENLLFFLSLDSLLYKIKSSLLKFITLLFSPCVWVFLINEFTLYPWTLLEFEWL